MLEELDMLFLLEHFSLEDLVKAKEAYENAVASDTDNLIYYQYGDEYANTSDKSLGDYDEDGTITCGIKTL